MMESTINLAEMADAFARRDRQYDGRFVVGVISTGIYCRPSCPARRPRAEHVRYLPDREAAEAQGFRPCLRCRPDTVAKDRQAVTLAIALLQRTPAPKLDELARAVGYSAAHFQRIFSRATGLSPAAYARALREERARDQLTGGAAVTEAIYDAGYESAGRFYDDMNGKLGMTPSAWLRGGQGVTIRWAVVETTLGRMLVAATEKGVCRLSFHEDVGALASRFPAAKLIPGGDDFAAMLQRVVDAVENPGTGKDIPLDVQGTAFQQRVWQELRRIPKGETRSYAQIAAAAGNPRAVRAAGSANGANNVAVLIPCHRVVRSDGRLGGYAYGETIKQELLDRERK